MFQFIYALFLYSIDALYLCVVSSPLNPLLVSAAFAYKYHYPLYMNIQSVKSTSEVPKATDLVTITTACADSEKKNFNLFYTNATGSPDKSPHGTSGRVSLRKIHCIFGSEILLIRNRLNSESEQVVACEQRRYTDSKL